MNALLPLAHIAPAGRHGREIIVVGFAGGRPKKITPTKLKAAKALMADDTITTREAAEHIGVSRATLCRALADERKRTDHAVAA